MKCPVASDSIITNQFPPCPGAATRSTHPICSISSRAWVMMLAPVKQTMPAISMEYQRALGGQAQPVGGALSGGHQGGQKRARRVPGRELKSRAGELRWKLAL